eukprot:CAMPEP_0174314882 /NCGR_PEP_ID=MMETSP0810-20121108/5920_1 /TAXON_ID=73025 ORGANISM="Eutreptiella gymnastica-like, Strain CCMP1594" /NCGR_SAMPLE_ID=MMETSP0810 /ASSEMBLY_ACC=CAM_ASM_000659 /LENGTH=145 /DNA_ID=CAMNT_0015424091 /DNA_START=16 /DNA_END=454 /DNA_ORIENTATION=-
MVKYEESGGGDYKELLDRPAATAAGRVRGVTDPEFVPAPDEGNVLSGLAGGCAGYAVHFTDRFVRLPVNHVHTRWPPARPCCVHRPHRCHTPVMPISPCCAISPMNLTEDSATQARPSMQPRHCTWSAQQERKGHVQSSIEGFPN